MIKDRVIQIIDIKGVKKEAFFERIGMTSASFRGNAKKTPLNSIAIENILTEFPDVNPDWLLTGRGEMFRNATPAESQSGGSDMITISKDEFIELQRKALKQEEQKVKELQKRLDEVKND